MTADAPKLFVLDTNVILHDSNCIRNFEEHDVAIPITAENLFLWFYSQMRGPSRALGTKWGMSIYGQAEPDLRLPSMKLAYDSGAEFIWMWTSDHDHHMNHSDNANTHWRNGHIVARRTIRKGEEITNNYREFDAGFCAAFLKKKK